MCHMWWPLILPYIFKVFWSIVRKFVIQLTHDVVTCYFPLQVQYPHVEAFGSPVTQISSMNILPVMALRYGPVTITLAMLTQCKGFPHLTRGGGGGGFSTLNANFSPPPVLPATRMSTGSSQPCCSPLLVSAGIRPSYQKLLIYR